MHVVIRSTLILSDGTSGNLISSRQQLPSPLPRIATTLAPKQPKFHCQHYLSPSYFSQPHRKHLDTQPWCCTDDLLNAEPARYQNLIPFANSFFNHPLSLGDSCLVQSRSFCHTALPRLFRERTIGLSTVYIRRPAWLATRPPLQPELHRCLPSSGFAVAGNFLIERNSLFFLSVS